MTLTLDVGSSSDDLIDTPPILEQMPEVEREPLSTRAQRYLRPTECPECGKKLALSRLSIHMKAAHPSAEIPETSIKPKTPKPPTGKRIKADDILTLVAGGVGSLLMVSGVSPPTGMALKLEAPLLGVELDNVVANTFVDKMVVQPIVKTKGKFEKVAPLVLFPAMIFALDKNPAMLPQAYPILRATMMEMLPSLIASKKKQIADAQKLKDAAAELAALDPEFAEMFGTEGMDPIDALIQTMFPQPPTPQPEEPGSAWDGSK